MDKRNKTALAYLLIGVAAAGRALLAVPEAAAIQEVSLTVLALVGYLLLAGEAKLPIVFGAAGLVLELILSGAQSGGTWVWLEPALRAVDLWLFWGAALVLLRPSDAGFAVDPQFNRSEKLNVYTDCTAAIEAMKAVEKPENITLHSLSEWNG